MLNALKQVRSAASLLNPNQVSRVAGRPLTIGLIAADDSGYAEMANFLAPAAVPRQNGSELKDRIFRAGDAGAPAEFDLLLCHDAGRCPEGALPFYPDAPAQTIAAILRYENGLSLPLARRFVYFRKPVVENVIHTVARENALFALTTSLPNIVPTLLGLPWAAGEWASDTAFLTMNQVRMAFMIAAACGRDPGFAQQKAELFSIGAGAFGWRAIARELVGKIPLGGGLIPKGAIAWAGTYIIGKGLSNFNQANKRPTRAERRAEYHEAYQRGVEVAEELVESQKSNFKSQKSKVEE